MPFRHFMASYERRATKVISRSGRVFCRSNGPDQNLGRNSQFGMQAADHVERKRSFAIENFSHPAAAAEQWFKIFARQILLLHPENYGIDGVGKIDRMMKAFIIIDKRYKQVKLIAFGRADLCTP